MRQMLTRSGTNQETFLGTANENQSTQNTQSVAGPDSERETAVQSETMRAAKHKPRSAKQIRTRARAARRRAERAEDVGEIIDDILSSVFKADEMDKEEKKALTYS
eukprot:CAMPEP_0173387710 /NCGR_PEP_ID=MMETSP1356-20130122/10169_1 /TAXON_ID=77927 ORGANISM="Hemiselmis virescens, Strain PCC157" /NCGR_SAMPLE_ID=MMETSP1356 /ASSEMBLY_ACC=CAM_ASM_000847 /LENGTH=105 /DNA_ID=CAMNT_0014344405 /DNA_START=117 /DNA_END=431 /DNA_ORIENTATION=+